MKHQDVIKRYENVEVKKKEVYISIEEKLVSYLEKMMKNKVNIFKTIITCWILRLIEKIRKLI